MQHGDPFGGANTQCIYSAADYPTTTVHPPLIGYSLDGYPIYGRHLDTENLGQSVALDDCGGHTHNGVDGYHYHAQMLVVSSSGQVNRKLAAVANPKQPFGKNPNPKQQPSPQPQPSPSPLPPPSPLPSPSPPAGLSPGSYVAYVAGPHKCWKADISKIANFWMKSGGPSAEAAYGVGGPVTNRVDYEQLRPCCGTSITG